jgi:formylglycine-generating enzyme required for sulfatase activity
MMTRRTSPRARDGSAPSSRGCNLGFRCARSKSTGSKRVSRGGSWYYVTARCRAAHRFIVAPTYYGNDIGLRCVRREG